MEHVSEWVSETVKYFPLKGKVLDLACGDGRHSKFLEDKGFEVTAVDIDVANIAERNLNKTVIIQSDLENGIWPFEEAQFDGIVVVNYLWREQFSSISNSLKSGGVLIYDTFCIGNEKYGRPRNPDFLLQSGELKWAFPDMDMVVFKEGLRENPSPAMRQSVVLRKR